MRFRLGAVNGAEINSPVWGITQFWSEIFRIHNARNLKLLYLDARNLKLLIDRPPFLSKLCPGISALCRVSGRIHAETLKPKFADNLAGICKKRNGQIGPLCIVALIHSRRRSNLEVKPGEAIWGEMKKMANSALGAPPHVRQTSLKSIEGGRF